MPTNRDRVWIVKTTISERMRPQPSMLFGIDLTQHTTSTFAETSKVVVGTSAAGYLHLFLSTI